MPIAIFSGKGPTLAGRSWVFSQELRILSPTMDHVAATQEIPTVLAKPKELEQLLAKHEDLFTPGSGLLKNVKVHLHIKKDVTPRFFKARTIPYALKDKVDEELQRLEASGIISAIPYSEHATPIVPVLKSTGKVRICGDFKITTNLIIDPDQYPLPKVEDILASLANCTVFSRLDMREAYSQLELDDESKRHIVINTHRGLFMFNRMPYGISSAAAIFQKQMEILLRNEKGTSPFQDDVLISGRTAEAHLVTLDAVLTIFRTAGLKLNRLKCLFMVPSLEFLGHRIDSKGSHPQESKMQAITNAPNPTSVDELRSFLGLLNYYHRFLKNNSSRLAPLYALLHKDTQFEWTEIHAHAFQEAKDMLRKSDFLVHYDPAKEVFLACDASPYGIGAVISHKIDEEDQPIAFASRTLSKAEKNYPQIEREALSLIFGIVRFRDYLLGRSFVLQTDHQPLTSILSHKKPVPAMAAARLQRWALQLSAYRYIIQYRKGSLHNNADAMSRLPLPECDLSACQPQEYVFLLQILDVSGPLKVHDIAEATTLDPVLKRIQTLVINGWPNMKPSEVPSELKPYYHRYEELSTCEGMLMVGNRVIIPEKHRATLLSELHDAHQGVTKMKLSARATVWWPGIDADIEEVSRTCEICQEAAPDPKRTFSPWPHSTRPFERAHMDFAGPLEGKFLLILIDSFTKWMEVVITSSTSTQVVTTFLRGAIARFGIILTVVTDNATCFSSEDFQKFAAVNGIRHLTSAPYHPPSNGLAERSVRTVKTILKKISGGPPSEAIDVLNAGLEKHSTGSLAERIDKTLLNYRRTPLKHGKSPAEMLYGRNLVSRLDLFHPRNLSDKTGSQKEEVEVQTAENHSPDEKSPTDKKNTHQSFQIGDEVYARNHGKGRKWLPGKITKTIGKTMFQVASGKSSLRRHSNQLRPKHTEQENTESCRTPELTVQEAELLTAFDFPEVIETNNHETPIIVPEPKSILKNHNRTPVPPLDPDDPNASTARSTEPNNSQSEPQDQIQGTIQKRLNFAPIPRNKQPKVNEPSVMTQVPLQAVRRSTRTKIVPAKLSHEHAC